MRGTLAWIVAIVAGVVLVLVVTAAVGRHDKSGDKVSAGEWAQSVCGAVGTWRGELEAILEEIRTPPSTGVTGTEEPQSQTPQGRTGLVRTGLTRTVEAVNTLVDGIDNAGVPNTAQGEQAAQKVSDWADSSKRDLENAKDTLHQEAGTLEEAVAQLSGAATAIRSVLASGVQTLAGVAALDPQLASAFRASSTCQQLREEQSSK